MKAYKIKIELIESDPLIWRRVIVPEETTFKRLHDIIQISMGWGNYYLYDFNLRGEKLRVTGDEEALFEYEFYSKKKLTEKNDPNGYVAKMLEMRPVLSNNVKIDDYLRKWKTIEYIYDFGDYWKHSVILEEIIEDCEYGHPTCIQGEEPCPPEDIGGITGYADFLEILKDKNHPEYKKTMESIKSQHYRYTFDIEYTNKLMIDMLS